MTTILITALRGALAAILSLALYSVWSELDWPLRDAVLYCGIYPLLHTFCVLALRKRAERAPLLLPAIDCTAAILLSTSLHYIFASPLFAKSLMSGQVYRLLFFLALGTELTSLYAKREKELRAFNLRQAMRRDTLWISALVLLLHTISPARDVRNNLVFSYRRLLYRMQDFGNEKRYAAQAVFSSAAFQLPVFLTEAPGDPQNIWLLERNGKLYEVENGSEAAPREILNISQTIPELEGELGAFAFALHPEFPAKPYLYLAYTAKTAADKWTNRLSRFSYVNDSGKFSEQSEVILIDQGDRHSWHNGGGLAFGPDGYLYYGVGDEGGNSDAYGNAQRIDGGLFSGILRISVDSDAQISATHPIARQPDRGKTGNYRIPNDNPFVGRSGALGEFWSIGLRNPYRFSFDPAGNQLWVADVGQDAFEEVNIAFAGSNHQWSYREGNVAHKASHLAGNPPDDLLGHESPPVFVYQQSALRRCIIGGLIYHGTRMPELAGQYLHGDCVSGEVFAYDPLMKSSRVISSITLGTLEFLSGVFEIDGEIWITKLSNIPAPSIFRLIKGSSTDEPEQINALSGAQLYQRLCSRCHGMEGKPSGNLQFESVKPPDFQSKSWQLARSDSELEQVIAKGGAARGKSAAMPAWERHLSKEQIEKLVRHVRTLAAE